MSLEKCFSNQEIGSRQSVEADSMKRTCELAAELDHSQSTENLYLQELGKTKRPWQEIPHVPYLVKSKDNSIKKQCSLYFRIERHALQVHTWRSFH